MDVSPGGVTVFTPKCRRAAEVRVSAENSRYENDKFRLCGTERGDCPVPTPSAGGLSPHPYQNDINFKENDYENE